MERKIKIYCSILLFFTLLFTDSLRTQAEEDSNLEKNEIEQVEEENIGKSTVNSEKTKTVKESSVEESTYNEENIEINEEDTKNDKVTETTPSEKENNINTKTTENELSEKNKTSDAETSRQPNEESFTQEDEQKSTSLKQTETKKENNILEEVEKANVVSEDVNENNRSRSTQETTAGTTQENNTQPRQGVLDVTLLSDSSLDASYSEDDSQIVLTYEGSGALDLSLLSDTYITFRLPSEIMNVISKEDLSASYNVPAVSIIIPIIRNRGTFDQDEINIEGNQVYMNFTSLLSLNLLSTENYEFTLTIDLEELPPTETGRYSFKAEATDQLVNLSILSEENIATATLGAPQVPNAPVIDLPVYTTDTQVTGTGEPNTSINLQIGNKEYTSQVDSAGNFSVDILAQVEGTEIQARIVDEQGYESNPTSAVVTLPPDTTPPDAPLVDPVFSNDTVINGEGEPNTAITLTANSTEYEGIVDGNGNYSVAIPEQEPGTIISAVLTDEAGNVSELTEVTVIEATVSFYNVPESLSFKSTEIGSDIVQIPREVPKWNLEVIDTRGPGSNFSVLAEAEHPLSTVNGNHTLPNSLVYVDGNGNQMSLSNGPVEVYSGQTGEDPITNIQWNENQGPLIEVDTDQVYAQSYDTAVTWTLVDAP